MEELEKAIVNKTKEIEDAGLCQWQYRQPRSKKENKVADNTSRPSVSVKVPEVRLRLEDLAFLRSVEQPVRCAASTSVINRLRFLDLIARAKVMPTEDEIREIETEKAAVMTALTEALKQEDWDGVSNAAYGLRSLRRRLAPREDDVLTDKGKALLLTGEVNVPVRKVGCL